MTAAMAEYFQKVAEIAAKEFWDAEYPKHRSNGFRTMAAFAQKVADEQTQTLKEQVRQLSLEIDRLNGLMYRYRVQTRGDK